MKTILKKVILMVSCVLLLACCLTGCMTTSSNVAFHWDGSVDYTVDYRIAYTSFGEGDEGKEYTTQYLDGVKSAIDEYGLNVQYTDTSDEEYGGLEFKISFNDVDAMNNSPISEVIAVMPAPIVGNGDGANVHLYSGNHFLYHTYQLLGTVTSADIMNFLSSMGLSPDSTEGMDMSQLYILDFSATAPTKLLTHSNAPVVNGATYQWTAEPTSEDVVIEFTTNVPTIYGFVLIGLILLAIIIGIILVLRSLLKKNKEETEESEDAFLDDAMESAEKEFYEEDSVTGKIAEDTDAFAEPMQDIAETAEEAVENAEESVTAEETEDAAEEIASEALNDLQDDAPAEE